MPLPCAVKPDAPADEPPLAGEAGAVLDDPRPPVVLAASNEAGVPARFAQPAASGPLGSHTSSPSGTSADADSAASRAR